jgi:DNA helicase II / ATP-dependent DNA helicase PcrA
MSLNRQKLKQKFIAEYEKLNSEQRLAVDTIEGPVMVIAGPGTGKTQILASRIGKILLDTDALPENILCLTYTDAGVLAMRRRLLQLIGTDAYKVNICTFHSFCNDVIQENLSLFEKTAMDPVSDIERTNLFIKLIDSFPKNHPLKRFRGDVYFEINNLEKLFSAMKRENWSAQFLEEKINAYLASLPQRDEYIAKRATKEFKKGDVRTDKIAEETEKIEKTRAAVNEFTRFQQMMRADNRYDFDDMITWVIAAFEEGLRLPGSAQAALLAGYQEKYQYILVDEYQDTSGTQNRITELLTSYWEIPNIFVVGDDDQSIYRFQGASVENMLDFAQKHEQQLVTVVLTQNYRSSQPILDAAMSLIERNNERLINQVEGLSKNLTAANTRFTGVTQQPVILEYETPEQEMAGITLRIAQLVEAGTPPANIAVIYRENKYGTELARYFKVQNLPYYTKRSSNILEIPVVKKILLVLRYLAAEYDAPYGGDEMLFEILHFNWFGIPSIEIAKLAAEAGARQFGENKISFRQLLCEKAAAPPKDLFTPGMDARLIKAIHFLEKMMADVPNYTLQQLVEILIRDSGILAVIMTSEEKNQSMQYVLCLFDFIKEETARNPKTQLAGFVKLVELMEKENIPLMLTETSGSDKGVNLLTAHGSKGLEFEYVFLAGTYAAAWEKKRKPPGGYSLPDTLFATAKATGEMEELRRLFFVAITRAEQFLTVSYSRLKADGKETEASVFVAEICEGTGLQPETVNVPRETLTSFGVGFFTRSQQPEIEKAEAGFIDRALEKFAMNVTALNNYLNCPLEFYFRNIVRIPSGKSEAAAFGSAVHFALQRLFEKMRDNNQVFPAQEIFIADFEWYMHRHRENFTKEQFERRMEYGHEILAAYYNRYINQFNKIVAVERNIRNVTINGIPLKGKLDKLEFDGKLVNVVDYKTGNVENARLRLKPPGDKDKNGGDYWRQAVFYKLLVDNYEQRDWKVMSTEFDFIEPDKKKNYVREKIAITPDDTDIVMAQIAHVWERIQERDFYTGCGKEDCHWCNFAKDHQLAVALHEVAEDAE